LKKQEVEVVVVNKARQKM
jgi:superfamily II DNA helicase RecQ